MELKQLLALYLDITNSCDYMHNDWERRAKIRQKILGGHHERKPAARPEDQ